MGCDFVALLFGCVWSEIVCGLIYLIESERITGGFSGTFYFMLSQGSEKVLCHNLPRQASEPYLDGLYSGSVQIHEQAVDFTRWLPHSNLKQREEGQLQRTHFHLSFILTLPFKQFFRNVLSGSRQRIVYSEISPKII